MSSSLERRVGRLESETNAGDNPEPVIIWMTKSEYAQACREDRGPRCGVVWIFPDGALSRQHERGSPAPARSA